MTLHMARNPPGLPEGGFLLQGDVLRDILKPAASPFLTASAPRPGGWGAWCLHPSHAGQQPKEVPSASLSEFLSQKWERVLHNQTSVSQNAEEVQTKLQESFQKRTAEQGDEQRSQLHPLN